MVGRSRLRLTNHVTSSWWWPAGWVGPNRSSRRWPKEVWFEPATRVSYWIPFSPGFFWIVLIFSVVFFGAWISKVRLFHHCYAVAGKISGPYTKVPPGFQQAACAPGCMGLKHAKDAGKTDVGGHQSWHGGILRKTNNYGQAVWYDYMIDR